MPTKRCCCRGATCVIAEDDFNRDGSDLGASWTHDPDEWLTVATPPWISGYAESEADDAIAIHTTPHRVPDESMHVWIDIINEVADSGDKYRVIVNAVDDENYHYAEYIRNGAATSVLRLGKCTAGSDSVLKSETITGLSDPIGEPRTLACHIADNEFCAEVSHAILSKVFVDEAVIPSGYYAGMGADDGCQISHWYFAEHAQTKPECSHCLCKCESSYIPPILNAHLEGAGRMAGLNCDITLTWDRIDSSWHGSGTCCGTQFWELLFTCPEGSSGYDVNTARLEVLGCIASDVGVDVEDEYYLEPGHRLANANSTCEPLSLEFGQFLVTIADLACHCGEPFIESGTYVITITEAP